MNDETVARFWAKVDKVGPTPAHVPHLGPCWVWTAYRNQLGYGVFRVERRTWLAHRVAFELASGEVIGGLLVLHRCDNPSCVRPAHLRTGSDADNYADMVSKGRSRRAIGERNGANTRP